jgi:hypothetical protein
MGTLITLNENNNPQVYVATGIPVATTITETESAIIRIPANTLQPDDMISVRAKVHKLVGGAPGSQSTLRVYHNNAPNLVGATLIATSGAIDSINNLQSFYREFIINGSNLYYVNPITSQIPDDLNSIDSLNSFIDLGNDLYLVFSIENFDLGDVCNWVKCVASIYR